MTDYLNFEFGKGIKTKKGNWYKCIQTLGIGGNAITLLVLSTNGNNKGVPFALKIFRKHSKPERRKEFLKEVSFLTRCDHASVIRVFDSGTYFTDDGECPFVVMEYLPRTLAQVIERGQTTLVEKLCYSCQLLSAINYLSSLKPAVVHRDIKPQNIFIKGQACVLGDFGLIKILNNNTEEDREILKESIGVGMPFFYRTPDLVNYYKGEKDITPKSDVFQLGLTLAELFTGRNPEKKVATFDDPVTIEVIKDIPGTVLSGSIYTLLKRMLVLDAAQREDASKLMDCMSGIFEEACEKALDFEGKAL